MDQKEKELYQAIISLDNIQECQSFFTDLCTPKELQDMAGRWLVAKLLYENKLSYREINELTGVSLATITRVARFLSHEPYQGYKMVIDKMNKGVK